MRTFIKAVLIILFFLIVLGAVLFKLLYTPHASTRTTNVASTIFPVATDSGVQDQSSVQIQQVKSSFLNDITNADQITLGRAKVAGSYAIQDWSDENKGGEALLKQDDVTHGWQLVSMGGGAWDVPSLVGLGVPEATAQQLIGS